MLLAAIICGVLSLAICLARDILVNRLIESATVVKWIGGRIMACQEAS